MGAGTSFVFKFEYFSAHSRPLIWLSRSLFNLTGIPASIHLYASAAGAQVLNPHTDPYDVLVWQARAASADGVLQNRTIRNKIDAEACALHRDLLPPSQHHVITSSRHHATTSSRHL